jgi:hypothetical protein
MKEGNIDLPSSDEENTRCASGMVNSAPAMRAE